MDHLLRSALPLVAAPMAGPTTLALAHATGLAGAFPFLAGGYKSPQSLAEQVLDAQAWNLPFGVNLFVPGPPEPPAEIIATYARTLKKDLNRYELAVPPIRRGDDDHWHEKLDLLLENGVPVVSFTFGLPPANVITRLKRSGTTVAISVTTAAEARAAEQAGADMLIVQGPHAGGHSATWQPECTPTDVTTPDLVGRVRAATKIPLVGAGGIDCDDAVHAILRAGAQAAAVGTLLLRTNESGASPAHQDALVSSHFPRTVITRAFTGRPARALLNSFISTHEPQAITAYPAVHHLTRELRTIAARSGDADRLHLWAGTGHSHAATGPASQVITDLSRRL